MSDWQRKLDLKDVWVKASAREITAQELAKVIAERLKALAPFERATDLYIYADTIHSDLVEQFEDFAQDDGDYNDLDYLLRELYDWGDIKLDNKWAGKKVCWIATF